MAAPRNHVVSRVSSIQPAASRRRKSGYRKSTAVANESAPYGCRSVPRFASSGGREAESGNVRTIARFGRARELAPYGLRESRPRKGERLASAIRFSIGDSAQPDAHPYDYAVTAGVCDEQPVSGGAQRHARQVGGERADGLGQGAEPLSQDSLTGSICQRAGSLANLYTQCASAALRPRAAVDQRGDLLAMTNIT